MSRRRKQPVQTERNQSKSKGIKASPTAHGDNEHEDAPVRDAPGFILHVAKMCFYASGTFNAYHCAAIQAGYSVTDRMGCKQDTFHLYGHVWMHSLATLSREDPRIEVNVGGTGPHRLHERPCAGFKFECCQG